MQNLSRSIKTELAVLDCIEDKPAAQGDLCTAACCYCGAQFSFWLRQSYRDFMRWRCSLFMRSMLVGKCKELLDSGITKVGTMCCVLGWKRCCDSLPCRQKFPLFFSQDGNMPHAATQEVAQSYEQVHALPCPQQQGLT